ncbi:hypothetical protein BJ165DRAFT_1530335 [Panaeolus papilionaceus]|nr:hypothetical protein BJ165DRAFT_1530335 [Panaeolus papilionaceus]
MCHADAAFPYGNFSLIINHLGSHPDYRQDLITLGNVSTTFAHLRRRYLFWEVKLGDDPSPEYHARLINLLSSHPELSTLPRHLVIHKGFSYQKFATQIDTLAFTSIAHPHIYPQFESIKKLSIRGHPTPETCYLPPEEEITRPLIHGQALDHFLIKGCRKTRYLGMRTLLPRSYSITPEAHTTIFTSFGMSPAYTEPLSLAEQAYNEGTEEAVFNAPEREKWVGKIGLREFVKANVGVWN